MFRFVELALQNWDFFQNVRLPLDGDVVLVTGPNGSGKTTLIDAIRQLIGAPRLSSKRRTEHYVRDPARFPLIRAVVSNISQNGNSRPFLHERIPSDEVTLACAVITNRGGELERRYAILPGRAGAHDLQHVLLESGDFYTPERYRRALQKAGLSRSMLHVIALEQGKTNALFEVSPRELFQRVIDSRGDMEILDRYRDARCRYEQTQKELNELEAGLLRSRRELESVAREVERLDEWIESRDRVVHAEAVLQAARLQERLRRKREVESQINNLTKKHRARQNEIAGLDSQMGSLVAAEAAATDLLKSATEFEQQAQQQSDVAVKALARIEAQIGLLEERRKELECLGPTEGKVEELEKAADAADQQKFKAEHEHEIYVEQIQTVEQKLERLHSGMSDYPKPVSVALEALKKENVSARLLAETVEIADPEAAEAAESALGEARYCLVVPAEQLARAVEIAATARFPGPVYSGPVLVRKTSTGPLVLDAGAPQWITSWYQTVELRANGRWSNIQGHWVAPTDVRVLGDSGRMATLARTENELLELRKDRAAAQKTLEQAARDQQSARSALRREQHRCVLSQALPKLLEARSELEDAVAAHALGGKQLSEARRRVEATRSEHESAATRLKDARLSRTREAEALKEIQTDLELKTAEAVKVNVAIAELDNAVSGDLRARAEQGDLTSPESLEYELEKAKNRFGSLREPPPDTVRDQEQVLRANVGEAERYVVERERESETAREELEECRRRYLEVVNQTLSDYRRRVREISALAGVASEIQLPSLVNDDRILDEAGIEVAFGFDGKDLVQVGHPSFSGGQQVIAGLILLMGMAETDSHGFFMLDEPFAHLSLDRIDHVGRFLRSTRSQFIITAPTTLERAQFDPAALLIVLQKKRAGEPFAPTPIVAKARQ